MAVDQLTLKKLMVSFFLLYTVQQMLYGDGYVQTAMYVCTDKTIMRY